MEEVSYHKTRPTVYAVIFEDVRVLKVGISSGQRWRNFVARGATVLALEPFDDIEDARVFERRNHDHLASTLERGFATADDASPYIGIGGGGWTETYAVPEGVDPMDILHGLPVAEGVAA